MKNIVIHHSADYDGVFCREIARRFVSDAILIGWDYGEPVPEIPADVDNLFMLDVSIPELMLHPKLIWIDHHKTAIEKYSPNIPGYRIDGVAACRLAFQYFSGFLPPKEHYVNRSTIEPLAVRLAGEYDVWDHRGDGDLELQYGLDSEIHIAWDWLLSDWQKYVWTLVKNGTIAMACATKRDADVLRARAFIKEWEGLKFLCLNTGRANSNTFAAMDTPVTGHDALLTFSFNGRLWNVSMYQAAHRRDIDLSAIASKYGGGGHRGACGFRTEKLPAFL